MQYKTEPDNWNGKPAALESDAHRSDFWEGSMTRDKKGIFALSKKRPKNSGTDLPTAKIIPPEFRAYFLDSPLTIFKGIQFGTYPIFIK